MAPRTVVPGGHLCVVALTSRCEDLTSVHQPPESRPGATPVVSTPVLAARRRTVSTTVGQGTSLYRANSTNGRARNGFPRLRTVEVDCGSGRSCGSRSGLPTLDLLGQGPRSTSGATARVDDLWTDSVDYGRHELGGPPHARRAGQFPRISDALPSPPSFWVPHGGGSSFRCHGRRPSTVGRARSHTSTSTSKSSACSPHGGVRVDGTREPVAPPTATASRPARGRICGAIAPPRLVPPCRRSG
jgi:hypothetical protein